MCLYISYNKPFVAKNDITVYKYVHEKYGKYYTVCRDYEVNINETIKADNKNDDIVIKTCNKYSIEGGAIYACTKSFDNGFDAEICLKAIIKKGTQFYIQDDLKEVAAKELYITDEVVTGKENTDLSEYLEDIIKNAESNSDNVVRVGYYRLSNGNFVNPFEYKDGTIIGVVAYFDSNDNPVCIGINFKVLPWTKSIFRYDNSSNISYNDTVYDMNGMRYTKSILNSKDYNSKNFAAVKYCRNYSTKGTKRGDWYLPAIGECLKIAQNILAINASLSKAGFETIDISYRLWSSSEHNDLGGSYTWYCDVLDADCYYYANNEVGTVVCMLKC